MEQMEQLLLPPRNAKGHFCNSRRSEEIFLVGVEGRGLMPITQITEISQTWDHKSSFFHSKVVSFAPGPHWGTSVPQTPWICSPGKISWLRYWLYVAIGVQYFTGPSGFSVHGPVDIFTQNQGSVASCLRCGGVVNNQIKKGLLLSLGVKKIKNRWIFG